jgi:hypothetical protein
MKARTAAIRAFALNLLIALTLQQRRNGLYAGWRNIFLLFCFALSSCACPARVA